MKVKWDETLRSRGTRALKSCRDGICITSLGRSYCKQDTYCITANTSTALQILRQEPKIEDTGNVLPEIGSGPSRRWKQTMWRQQTQPWFQWALSSPPSHLTHSGVNLFYFQASVTTTNPEHGCQGRFLPMEWLWGRFLGNHGKRSTSHLQVTIGATVTMHLYSYYKLQLLEWVFSQTTDDLC